MDKKIVEAVLERSQGYCEVEGCGSNDRIELHHIISGFGRRKQCENEHSVIALCRNHHRGTKGVHGRDGHTLSITLKRQLQQKYFDMGHKEDTVRRLLGGKLYD